MDDLTKTYRTVLHPRWKWGWLADEKPVNGVVRVAFWGGDPVSPYIPVWLSDLNLLAGWDMVNDGGRLPNIEPLHPSLHGYPGPRMHLKIERNFYQEYRRATVWVQGIGGRGRYVTGDFLFMEEHSRELDSEVRNLN